MGKAFIPGDFKRLYKRSPCDSGVLFYWLTVLTCIHFNRPVMSWHKEVYRSFFQFWLIFPNRNCKSRANEYNVNWYWHHTLHLKEETFPIFENFLKPLRTTTKVPSCLKIPLTSMRVNCFVSFLTEGYKVTFPEYRPNASGNALKQIQGASNASFVPFFAGKTVLNEASWVIRRKRFDFDHVTFTSHVCTWCKVVKWSESSSISGSDYSDFEASMEAEHNERVYEPIG